MREPRKELENIMDKLEKNKSEAEEDRIIELEKIFLIINILSAESRNQFKSTR